MSTRRSIGRFDAARLTKLLIAAIVGYAVAAGLELALRADLRIVEERATFGMSYRMSVSGALADGQLRSSDDPEPAVHTGLTASRYRTLAHVRTDRL